MTKYLLLQKAKLFKTTLILFIHFLVPKVTLSTNKNAKHCDLREGREKVRQVLLDPDIMEETDPGCVPHVFYEFAQKEYRSPWPIVTLKQSKQEVFPGS